MAAVITQGSTIECLHKGKVTPVSTAVADVLVVGDHPALAGTLVTSTISGCEQNKKQGDVQCAAVDTQNPGSATSTVLYVGDAPVLLGTASGTTTLGAPTNTWSVDSAGQDLLTAD
ncbi:hypothetical protein ACWHLZ_15080 [Streptomyces chartreusis]|jgi:hypothetical protein|uniref:hypothetical protein n=1 Tax=Streptomyces TaxID=1883 RepID=UPI00381039B5|nr:hypothetical protein OIA45_08870 [Streptomyces chartreusis]